MRLPCSLFDAGTHVPFFVYWKGKIRPVVSDALVCQMDLAASIASLIGAETPETLDSENLLPALKGKSTKGRDELIVEAQGKLAIRKGNTVMIPPYSGPEYNATGNELGNLAGFALFDVATDRQQLNNRAQSDPGKLEAMKAFFFELTANYYKAEVEEVPLK